MLGMLCQLLHIFSLSGMFCATHGFPLLSRIYWTGLSNPSSLSEHCHILVALHPCFLFIPVNIAFSPFPPLYSL